MFHKTCFFCVFLLCFCSYRTHVIVHGCFIGSQPIRWPPNWWSNSGISGLNQVPNRNKTRQSANREDNCWDILYINMIFVWNTIWPRPGWHSHLSQHCISYSIFQEPRMLSVCIWVCFVTDRRVCTLILQGYFPDRSNPSTSEATQRTHDVMITSKRRRDVVLT